MKKNTFFLTALLAVTLVFGLVFVGCDTTTGPGPGNGGKLSLAEVKTELKASYEENPTEFATMLASWVSEGLTLTLDPNPNNWSDSDWSALYAWLDAKGYLDEGSEGTEGTGDEAAAIKAVTDAAGSDSRDVMKAALENNASALGLNLTAYNKLDDNGKLTVADWMQYAVQLRVGFGQQVTAAWIKETFDEYVEELSS